MWALRYLTDLDLTNFSLFHLTMKSVSSFEPLNKRKDDLEILRLNLLYDSHHISNLLISELTILFSSVRDFCFISRQVSSAKRV